MTEPYVPQVGHRVKVEVVGTFIKDIGNGWLSLRLNSGNDLYLPSTETWTRMPEPEPDWQPGDIVIDAGDDAYVRAGGHLDPWVAAGERYADDWLQRPLTRLVRETPA